MELTHQYDDSRFKVCRLVGTTRTRIGVFIKRFRELGLIEQSEQHCLIVKEEKLSEYIDRLATLDERPRESVGVCS